MSDKVIIITLNYNQNEYTLKCIESILKSNYNNFKILLIDNGSKKSNYKELKKKLSGKNNLTIERLDDNVGYVGGVNYGLSKLRKLKAKYVLIMNNDTIIDCKAITNLVKACKNKKLIVTGKVYHYNDPNRFQDIGYEFLNKNTLSFNRLGLNELDNGQFNCIEERDMIDDVFWLFPIELYEEIGGYSNYFWFNAEQEDFALRAKGNGYKLLYTPNAKLWHMGSVTIGGRTKNPKLVYFHIQSILIVTYLHTKKRYFLMKMFSILVGTLTTFVKSLIFILIGDFSYFKIFIAKIFAIGYFIKWFFYRNENNGNCPIN